MLDKTKLLTADKWFELFLLTGIYFMPTIS